MQHHYGTLQKPLKNPVQANTIWLCKGMLWYIEMTFYTLNKSYFRQKINAFKRDALIIGKVVVLIRYFCSCSAIKYIFSDSCMKNQSKFILPLFTAQSPDYNWIISKISVNSTHPRWFSMMLSSFSRSFFHKILWTGKAENDLVMIRICW